MNDAVHVLIVEDEPSLQEVYKLILSMQGYLVRTASNGQAALQAIAERAPDLILLDVLMPIMDGREFMRNFDRNTYPDVKIVVSSNLSDQEILKEMVSLGADKVVLKSDFTPNVLIETVETMTVKN